MGFTLERIIKECQTIALSQGFHLDTPVKINGRLTTTLGRVCYHSVEGVIVPTAIEFSKHFIENATEDEVIDTIRHEMAHWLATTDSGENHGHDNIWKQWCVRIGGKTDRCYKVENMSAGAVKTKAVKYQIYCKHCGKMIATRTRACKLTKFPSMFTSTCCKASLIVNEMESN